MSEVTPEEEKLILELLQKLPPSDVAKRLPKFTGPKYREYKEKVEAVQRKYKVKRVVLPKQESSNASKTSRLEKRSQRNRSELEKLISMILAEQERRSPERQIITNTIENVYVKLSRAFDQSDNDVLRAAVSEAIQTIGDLLW